MCKTTRLRKQFDASELKKMFDNVRENLLANDDKDLIDQFSEKLEELSDEIEAVGTSTQVP